MSEDREKKAGRHADGTGGEEEVRAHVKSHRGANDEAEGDEEVRAHVKGARGASDDDGDDVEAHVKSGR